MKPSKETQFYPYRCLYKGTEKLLIWKSLFEGDDSFLLDNGNNLVISTSKDALRKKVGNIYHQINWPEEGFIDFDKFWIALRNLRPNKASSNKTCNVLLEGWNFIEDLGKSLGHYKTLEILKTAMLNKCYDKLFYGNNLPSITPENKSYNPLWSKEEIQSIRNAFKIIWRELRMEKLL